MRTILFSLWIFQASLAGASDAMETALQRFRKAQTEWAQGRCEGMYRSLVEAIDGAPANSAPAFPGDIVMAEKAAEEAVLAYRKCPEALFSVPGNLNFDFALEHRQVDDETRFGFSLRFRSELARLPRRADVLLPNQQRVFIFGDPGVESEDVYPSFVASGTWVVASRSVGFAYRPPAGLYRFRLFFKEGAPVEIPVILNPGLKREQSPRVSWDRSEGEVRWTYPRPTRSELKAFQFYLHAKDSFRPFWSAEASLRDSEGDFQGRLSVPKSTKGVRLLAYGLERVFDTKSFGFLLIHTIEKTR